MSEKYSQPDGTAQPQSDFQPFALAFAMLDTLLVKAVEDADALYGPQARQDLFRGLYITPDDVGRLFRRSPGEPIFHTTTERMDQEEGEPGNGSRGKAQPAPEKPPAPRRRPFPWVRRWFSNEEPATAAPASPPASHPPERRHAAVVSQEVISDALAKIQAFRWLSREYGLSDFDLTILLIALAPELDLRYERLYAYLQDDVTRRRPSVDLVLNLLCATAQEKAHRRAHFATDAPLIRAGLIHLVSDREDANPPLLARYFRLDTQVVNFILGQDILDPGLAAFSRLDRADYFFDELPLEEETRLALSAFSAWSRDSDIPLRLFFSGVEAAVKRKAAEALATSEGAPLLSVDIPLALASDRDLAEIPGQLVRQAHLTGAVLLLEGVDALVTDGSAVALGRLLDALEECRGVVILAGSRAPTEIVTRFGDLLEVHFTAPEYHARRAYWEQGLANYGIFLRQEDLDALSGRFLLTNGQIDQAVADAVNRARWRESVAHQGDPAWLEKAQPRLSDLYAASRQQTGRDLNHLAQKVSLHYSWDDIVLPPDSLEQLREIFQRVAYRHRVMDEWGFDDKISLGKGVTVLFAGPSGTGKTMAAEIIANELGLDLYKIDLSGVVSKYIGETEKNLDRIFTAASQANAILFFDEADAIFGKRSEVRDSHDRYANIEISYLLQKMEEYEGIAILSTNLRQNLDDAFLRRMAFTVHFPFPDEASRRKIWEGIWPRQLPREELDFNFLANQYRVTGGNIKNIAIAAAFLAAQQDKPVCMEHIYHAVKREFQKLGKTMTDAELYGEKGREVHA